MSANSTIAAAEAVCRRWIELSLPFVVTHGLETYPDRLGRDLDILMRPSDARIALSEAAQLLRDLGWDIRVCPPRLWGRRLVALHEDEGGGLDYLELHTIRSLRWAALTLVDDKEPATGVIGCFPVSAWATFAKAILTPSLAGDTARFDTPYLEGLKRSGVGDDSIVQRMAAHFGRDLSKEVVRGVVDVDVGTLRRIAPQLRRRALGVMVRHPGASARTLPRLLRQKLGRFVSRTGLRVEIGLSAELATDRFIEQLVDRLGKVFPRVAVSQSDSPIERVRQQYRILSRQGVVLHLRDVFRSDVASVTVGLAHLPGFGLLRKPGQHASFTSRDCEVASRAVSRWIINQWSSRFPCRVSEKPLHT